MHRLITALAMLAILVLLLPSAVLAGKVIRQQEHVLEAFCDASGDDAIAFVGTFIGGDDAFVDLVVWTGGSDPATDPPDLTTGSADVTGGGLAWQADVALIDANGEPAGTATVDLQFSPDGDPIPVDDRFREGNAWFEAEGTVQPLVGTVESTLPGGEIVAGSCAGEERDLVIFQTDPSARIRNVDNVVVECDLDGPDGHLYLGIDVNDDGGFAFGDVSLDGQPLAVIDGGGELAGDQITVDGLTLDPFDGSPVGEIQATVTLTPTGETYRHVLPYSNGPITVSGTILAVEGTATVSVGDADGSWDLGACVGGDQHIKDQLLPMKGPKAKGKPVANDTPAGATALTIGQAVRQPTRTTVPEAEAPSSECLGFDIAHTLWFAVTAPADGPLTVDTNGSDFDTAVAVYESGDLSTAIACADDVFSMPLLQHIEAVVTFDAVAGTTYLIQAGSFPGPGQPYGRLDLVVE